MLAEGDVKKYFVDAFIFELLMTGTVDDTAAPGIATVLNCSRTLLGTVLDSTIERPYVLLEKKRISIYRLI